MIRSWKHTLVLLFLMASVPLRALAGGGMILCDARSGQTVVTATAVQASTGVHHHDGAPVAEHDHGYDQAAHGHPGGESVSDAALEPAGSHDHSAQAMDDKSCDLCGLCHLLCAPAMVHAIASFEDSFSHVFLSRAVPHALFIVPPRAERPPLA
jgi:hypothetical protein